MPYQVKKVGSKFKLYNLYKKKFVNVKYKSKQSAINSAKAFMRYRREKPYVKGSLVLARGVPK